MVNPRRLLLLIAGFGFFYGCYLVYAQFLGHYDGLPPLPAEFRYVPGEALPPVARADVPSRVVEMLREVFGPNCEEQHRRLKFEWRKQGIVMSADRWKILENGQLRLSKVSVGVLGRDRGDGKREINAIRGDQADVEFDQPLSEQGFMREAQSRRPVSGRIAGSVHLRNNRRTANPDDDLHLYTPWLAYSDAEHRVWTKADVRLVDSEAIGSLPQAIVTAQGMEVFLEATESPPQGKGKNKEKDKKASITGVRMVRLEKNVCMDLMLDERSTFLNPKAGKQPPGAKQPEEGKVGAKSPVVINCRGPFTYTVAADVDSDPDRAEFHDLVNVIRKQTVAAPPANPGGAAGVRYDQLDCDLLTLLLSRKRKDGTRREGDDRSVDLDLVSARATGKLVELVSDGEGLHATATEMLYDKANGQTVLKGEVVQAERDGHHFNVRGTLTLSNPKEGEKEIQDAVASGPGEIRLKADKPGVIRIARWNESLKFGKDGALEKLTLQGLASFEDTEQGRLQADQLMLWLEARAAPEKATAGQGSPTEGRMLRRMEAHHNVALRSQDLIIHRTERLRVFVQDVEPSADGQPTAEVAKTKATATSGFAKDKGDAPADPRQVAQAKPGTPATPAPGGGPTPPAKVAPTTPKQKQPIEVTGRMVDVHLRSDGKKSELHEAHVEGQVLVQQKAVHVDDKAVEVKGDRLSLEAKAGGNVMTVVGQPGYAHLDRVTILGPLINVDQPENIATVQGSGSMKLPSKTDFEGNPLKEPTEVTIYWGQRMFFDGQLAEFDQHDHGTVQARQGNARLACRMMQVVLDRKVSLKEKQPGQGDQPAALHRMLCMDNVRLEKGIKQGDRWIEFERIEGEEALFENPTGELRVSGPGTVYLLRQGNKQNDLLGSQPKPNQPKAPVETEMKLTRVQFQGRMTGNENTGVVTFTDQIELVHLPANDPDVVIKTDNLPQGAMHLRCNQLKALNRKIDERVTSQEFEATGRVSVKAQSYTAQADVVKYDESKDLLILEGHGLNQAKLYRQTVPGGKPDPFTAKRILYWRKDNRVSSKETEAIHVNP